MNKSPLVSIAMCTYNGEEFLIEQLNSLINQSHRNLEIIITDDCSSDKTISILEDFCKKFKNIKLFKNDFNLGYIKNFEKVISLCNGEYIALCDQDDIWELNKISIMLNGIGENILLYHDSMFMNEKGIPIGKKMSDVRNFYSGSDFKPFLFENCISGHSMMFKKELTTLAGTFPTEIFHDWWIAFVATNNGKIEFINECLVKYRQHDLANTNILRLDRGKIKKRNVLIALEKEFQRLSIFTDLPSSKNQIFKNQLLTLFKKRMNSYFSFGLAYFIFRNKNTLLFMQKKSDSSKFNFILKYAWGYKLKKFLAN